MADDVQPVGCRRCKRFSSLYCRVFILILTPVIFSPIIIQSYTHTFQCIFIVCCMATYFVTEVVPIHVTGMIPMVAFPFFGILNSNEVCEQYFSSPVVMMFGGITLGISIENSQLHHRLALNTTKCIGVNFRRLHFGIMIITASISMWISNLATTTLMTPTVCAILQEFQVNNMYDMYVDKQMEGTDRVPTPVTKAFLIGIAFSATLGGSTSLIGSSANMAILGIYETSFPNSKIPLDFLKFFCTMILPMITVLLLTILTLQIIHLGLFRSATVANKVKVSKEEEAKIREILNLKLIELGRFSLHEFLTLLLFVSAIILCSTKTFGSIGWGVLMHPSDSQYIRNSVTFVFIVFLMLTLPKSFECCNFCRRNQPLPKTRTQSVLEWAYINKKFPWHLLFLVGGGFATAKGLKVSGGSVWLAERMAFLKSLPPFASLVMSFTFVTLFTNFTSNVSVANIVLPIFSELAISIGVHPLYFLLACGVACSFAFLLPVGTPANAFIAVYGNISTQDLMISGILPTLYAIGIYPALFEISGRIFFPRVFENLSVNSTSSAF